MKFFFNPNIDISHIFSNFTDKKFDNQLLSKISINFVFENESILKIEEQVDSSLIAIKGEQFERWFNGDVYYDYDSNTFKASKSGFISKNQDIIKIFDPYFIIRGNLEAFFILPDYEDKIKNKLSYKSLGEKTFKDYFYERCLISEKSNISQKEKLFKNFNHFIQNQYEELNKKGLSNFNHDFFKKLLSKNFNIKNYNPGFYLIAKGTLPVNGRCEKIIPLIEDKILPGKFESKDRMNYFERDFLKSVSKGDTLARILPEIKPVDGWDVYGNIIPASYDNKPFFLPGENVEKKGNLLVSKINGVISFKKNTINVFDLYKIDGDISVYTGNIHCNSTLIVSGSILENISVEVKGDLIVNGNIENPGSLIVNGNLICKGGIIGSLNKKYIVNSSLYATFIENSFFEVKGNICVDKEIVRSKLYSGKNIIVTYKNGVVVGSELHFGGHLLLKYGGTSHGSSNKSFLGYSFLAENNLKILKSLYEKYNYLEKNYIEIKRNKTIKVNFKKRFTKTDKNYLKDIDFSNLKLNNIKFKRKIIYKLLNRSKNKVFNKFSKIVVMNNLYPGNLIIGKKEKKEIKKTLEKPLIFYDYDYKIMFSKVSAKNIDKLKDELERFYKLKNFENNINQKKVEIKDAKKAASEKDRNITFKNKWGSFR